MSHRCGEPRDGQQQQQVFCPLPRFLSFPSVPCCRDGATPQPDRMLGASRWMTVRFRQSGSLSKERQVVARPDSLTSLRAPSPPESRSAPVSCRQLIDGRKSRSPDPCHPELHHRRPPWSLSLTMMPTGRARRGSREGKNDTLYRRSQPLLAWISLLAITIVPAVGPQRACRAIGTMGHPSSQALGTRLFPSPPGSIPVLQLR